MAPKHITTVSNLRHGVINKLDSINTDAARTRLGWVEGRQQDRERDNRHFAAIFIVLGMSPTAFENAASIVRKECIRHFSTTKMGATLQYSNIPARITRNADRIQGWMLKLNNDADLLKATLLESNATIPV